MDESVDILDGDRSLADDVVEELMPAELDWRGMVRRYPMAALAVAALGGWVLGRHRGEDILRGLSNFAADTVSEQVNELLGRDVI